jgi:hypothetical protein
MEGIVLAERGGKQAPFRLPPSLKNSLDESGEASAPATPVDPSGEAPSGLMLELQEQVKAQVEAVSNDPAGRIAMRETFYRRFGFANRLQRLASKLGIDSEAYGYGASEISFLRWMVERGVLNPIDGPHPGSPWWRKVDSVFLYYAQLAAAAVDRGATDLAWSRPVRYWLDYIADPGSKAWYRAHNGSIARGYQQAQPLADAEGKFECEFMGVVLYRLFYAQAMVEGATAYGRLGRLLANPRTPSVEMLVHLPDFYPDDYPLSRESYDRIVGKYHSVGDVAAHALDEIILHQLGELFGEVAVWIELPEINGWVQGDRPIYPGGASGG